MNEERSSNSEESEEKIEGKKTIKLMSRGKSNGLSGTGTVKVISKIKLKLQKENKEEE